MSELRSTEERKADVLAVMERNGDAWLATADRSGRPHLIAVSTWWDGSLIVIEATSLEASRTVAAGDPFAKAGLFAKVEIRPWLWTMNNPEEEE